MNGYPFSQAFAFIMVQQVYNGTEMNIISKLATELQQQLKHAIFWKLNLICSHISYVYLISHFILENFLFFAPAMFSASPILTYFFSDTQSSLTTNWWNKQKTLHKNSALKHELEKTRLNCEILLKTNLEQTSTQGI